MATLRLLLLLLGLLCASALRYDVVSVTGNPHMTAEDGQTCAADCKGESVGCPALGVVDPTVVLDANIQTQAGTFLKLVRKTYMGRELPIFHFKQPAVLNPNQLPFKILRVSHLDMSGMMTIPVEPAAAYNSWFPEYYWDVLVCRQCSGVVHLGWKFTSKSLGAADSFYALIVDYTEGHEREATTAERLIERLQIGVRAPAWMAAMAMTRVMTK
jgi:hypothetical protein|eukprot:CAMPEP_0174319622 /NCGR_PEP_ID=MMETSP0810-20121108/8989_1 /TAXON_ID=73025 ORGANISM="Eutreptiella gymnastica-like, Strain CCMP1594" /NCGR_SAMPLE_ID=MMETSP0810 /ASSEMBLY_ACC=CAM_ASM_000659 /LENGTH=213 /DNA_ID=CAMNT_0015430229 /DNA_START=22 /DNA_END=663 /DNA_ORIENTATION=-